LGTEQENVITELFRHWLAPEMNLDGIVDLLSEDIVRTVPSLEPIRGRDAVRAEQERENAFVRFGLPGSELRTVASSDGVVFAEYMDVFEINGKRVSLPVVGVFEVVNSKIVTWREFFDTAEVAKQLGSDATP